MERGIPVFNFPTETITALDKVMSYQLRHKHIKPIVVKEEVVEKIVKKTKKVNVKKNRK